MLLLVMTGYLGTWRAFEEHLQVTRLFNILSRLSGLHPKSTSRYLQLDDQCELCKFGNHATENPGSCTAVPTFPMESSSSGWIYHFRDVTCLQTRQCEQRTVPDYADRLGTKALSEEPPAEHIPGQTQQLGYPTPSQFTRSHTPGDGSITFSSCGMFLHHSI
jgi:hypothetical protein